MASSNMFSVGNTDASDRRSLKYQHVSRFCATGILCALCLIGVFEFHSLKTRLLGLRLGSSPMARLLPSIGKPQQTTALEDLLLPTEEMHIDQSIIESVLARYPGTDNLVVVFSDREYLDFTLNSHASFQKNAPEDSPYIVIGMDKETVDKCNKNNILSFSYSDITELRADSETALEHVAARCIRMEVVSKLQQAGFNVLLMDSDIALAEPFDLLGYFSQLNADFSSGHGTFPQDMFAMNGFALQSGFYYVKATEAARRLMGASTALCYEMANGQVALNKYVMRNFQQLQQPRHPVDAFGTRIFKLDSKLDSGFDVSIAVAGRAYFPTGCKFVEYANPRAIVRHPGCLQLSHSMSLIQKKFAKKASLQQLGAWFLPAVPKKALFWTFPGSGNTMLRYSFEKITGKIGSTNSINYDKRLSPVLPGEGRFDGLVVKVHPLLSEKFMTERQRTEIFDEIPKRVVLVRNPFDAIWSWYQLAQTASHTKNIKTSDFNPAHFATQALKWADLYRSIVEEQYVPFVRDHPNRVFVIKFDDLIKKQSTTLRALLDFLEEEKEDPSTELRIYDHPLIHRESSGSNYINKAAAYAATEGLVDMIWRIVEDAASRYGFSKPTIAEIPSAISLSPSMSLDKLSGHRYLTYSPTGGLTNQLVELETAVQLAQVSGRTLLLPPLLAEHVGLLPDVWKDESAARTCTSLAASAVHDSNLDGVETYQWNRIIDMKYLSSRVKVAESIPDDIAALASRLSLFEYHKCNTKWVLNETIYDRFGCLPNYTQELRPLSADPTRTIRSARCLFESSNAINVLNFGGIFGATQDEMIFPDVRFSGAIRPAAEAVVQAIKEGVHNQYACVQMRLAGGTWESQSPFIADRESNFELVRDFLTDEVQDVSLPLYVATDNEELMRQQQNICGQRRCLFASDFNTVTQSFGLSHFLETNAIDYLVCSQADYLFTSPRSSFGAFIRQLHDQGENFDGVAAEPKTHLTSHPYSISSSDDGENKKYAFVTLLGWNPDKEQYNTYVAATRALVFSLLESGSSADVVVMVLNVDEPTKTMLTRDGAIVVEIEPLISSPEGNLYLDWFATLALAKVRVFELTQYDRFQFLDSDVILLEGFDLDHLFDFAPHSGMVSEGLGNESPIRSGWFMARPSRETFERLQGIARRGRFSTTRGWDYLDLPVSYPGWDPRGGMSTDSWNFYGAQLEQGLFFQEFYAMPKSRSPGAPDDMFLKLLDDDTMYSNGLVHCYGNLKPWNSNLDLEQKSERILAAHQRWSHIVTSIEWQDTIYLASHYENPLTDTGRRSLAMCVTGYGVTCGKYKVPMFWKFGAFCHERCVHKHFKKLKKILGWKHGCCP